MAHRPDSLVIRSRVDYQTGVKKHAFITALKKVATVSVACEIAGVSRPRVYEWRNEDNEFAEQWDNALTFAFEGLESATYLKVADVLKSPHKRIAMPEAKLIELFLAGAKPEKYRQRAIEIDNSQNIEITVDWSKVPQLVMAEFMAGRLTLQDVYQATLVASPVENTEKPAE